MNGHHLRRSTLLHIRLWQRIGRYAVVPAQRGVPERDGRCGNYVLQDQMDNLIRIFVYADTVTRIRRVMDVDKVDEAEALRRMKRIDKERTEYHRYFTGREWMDMENYDLPINASRIDYDQMIQLIKDYLKLRGFL